MAMTKNEAEERAAKVWPNNVASVAPDFALPGGWSILDKKDRYHVLDGNGHAVCHQRCVDAEASA